MSRCDIHIAFDRDDRTYRGGERVSGMVTIRAHEDFRCNGILLQHYWKTHGRGNVDSGTRQEIRLQEAWSFSAGDEREFPFEFDSERWPLTYRGHFVNVDHVVQVSLDIPWARDSRHEEDFIVLPGDIPEQFRGDRTESADLQDAVAKKPASSGGLVAKVLLGLLVLIIAGLLIVLFTMLLPIFIVVGIVTWLRRTAVRRRLGEVECRAPVVKVGPEEPWRFHLAFTPRRSFRINEISARLLVQEVAVSGSGTNKTTHRHTLYDDKVILEPSGFLTAGESFSRSSALNLPDTQAWSIKTDDNSIEWTVDVRIDIPWYPDWSKKFELQMLPPAFLSPLPDGSADTTLPPDPSDTPAPSGAASDPSDNSRTGSDREPLSSSADSAVDAVDRQSVPATIFELVSAIQAADRYGSERSRIADSVAGMEFDVPILIDRVSSTLGLSDAVDPDHRDGRTITGTIAGTEQDVQLFTRAASADDADALTRGDVWEARVHVRKWDSLYSRLVLSEI